MFNSRSSTIKNIKIIWLVVRSGSHTTASLVWVFNDNIKSQLFHLCMSFQQLLLFRGSTKNKRIFLTIIGITVTQLFKLQQSPYLTLLFLLLLTPLSHFFFFFYFICHNNNPLFSSNQLCSVLLTCFVSSSIPIGYDYSSESCFSLMKL